MTATLSARDARRLLGWGPVTVSAVGDVEQAQDITWADGDLVLDAGLANLRQDLSAALVTALGADPLNPSFGFDGFSALAEEQDKFILRERLRVAVVNTLRRDRRIDRVDQVLIGDAEIAAARAGSTSPPPATTYGVVEIIVGFRLRGRSERLELNIGSILGSG